MTRRPAAEILAVVLLATCGRAAAADQSIGWRNDGSGRFPQATPPLEWSETKNVVWKTKIGPNKFSSPVVVDGKIFVIADPALLCCVDAADGKILWQKPNGFADLPGKVEAKQLPGNTDNTTPTPVSDGQFVYAVFGNGIVACYDTKGARQWIRHFDLKPTSEYGRAASPLLAGGRLFVTLSYLIALDPRTGREIWKSPEVPECFGTPVATKIAGVDVLVMPSGQIVRAGDGVVLAANLGGLKFASPVVQDDTVYLLQGGSSAQRLSAAISGPWKAEQVWEQELEGTFYASAVWDRGLLYAVANESIFSILDAKDGKVLATENIEFPEDNSRPDAPAPNLYPSITLAGKYLFVFNDHGDGLVIEPGRQYRELKRNHLGTGHGGTPAFNGSRIYLRSGLDLYCVGE